jgi:hypothetical protein
MRPDELCQLTGIESRETLRTLWRRGRLPFSLAEFRAGRTGWARYSANEAIQTKLALVLADTPEPELAAKLIGRAWHEVIRAALDVDTDLHIALTTALAPKPLRTVATTDDYTGEMTGERLLDEKEQARSRQFIGLHIGTLQEIAAAIAEQSRQLDPVLDNAAWLARNQQRALYVNAVTGGGAGGGALDVIAHMTLNVSAIHRELVARANAKQIPFPATLDEAVTAERDGA